MNFQRITVHPKQMAGVPCIRGLRWVVVVGFHRGTATRQFGSRQRAHARKGPDLPDNSFDLGF